MSKRKKPIKCKKTGKTRFPTRKLASNAMMRTISHNPNADMFDLHPYQCDECGGWHFGHYKKYVKYLEKQGEINNRVPATN